MTLLKADAISLPLADESVDLVVTSPPYFALRSYTDGGEHYDGQIGSEDSPQAFLEALWAVTAECRRVLKPTGSLWVNLGDKYAGSGGNNNSNLGERATRRGPSSYSKASDVPAKSLMGLPWRYAIGCVDQLDLILRAEVVWSKPNGLPESVTDRVRRSHEQWFHMTKEPRYFAAVDEIREPHSGGSNPGRSDGAAPPAGKLTRQVEHGDRGGTIGGTNPDLFNPLGKLPGSVWTIPSEPLKVPDHLGVDHFAAFPQEWPRRIILGWSPSGYCVECGEARVTCVDSTPMPRDGFDHRKPDAAHGKRGVKPAWSGQEVNAFKAAHPSTITGYACACDEPTAPTRPAVVLDPFGGTGTVAMVARALGRYPVHVDLSADYLRLARWRIYESGHASKTTERTNRERQQVLL